MAYEKQNFIPGQKLKAAELNHMEDGIVNAVSVTEQTLSEAQKSQARKNLDLDDIAGAHIGPEAPPNGEKLWIDTDEEVEGPKDGKDGVSPTVSVSDITGGHRITITDASGTKTVDVMDGKNGAAGVGIVSITITEVK